MKLIKDKNVVITGATRGIGKGIAIEFAKHGCNVAFTYSKSVDQANDLIKELESYNVQARGYQSDASVFLNADGLIKSVLMDFSKIDILVNNAGINGFENRQDIIDERIKTNKAQIKEYSETQTINTHFDINC